MNIDIDEESITRRVGCRDLHRNRRFRFGVSRLAGLQPQRPVVHREACIVGGEVIGGEVRAGVRIARHRNVRNVGLRRRVLGNRVLVAHAQARGRLVHVRHSDRDGLGRVIGAVSRVDGDVVFVVRVRILRVFEIRRVLERDLAGGRIDVEQVIVAAGRQRIGDGVALILIDGLDLVGDRSRIFRDRAAAARGDGRRVLGIGDGNLHVLGVGQRTVGHHNLDVVNVVAACITRLFEVRRRLERHRAGIRVDVELIVVGAAVTKGIMQRRAGIDVRCGHCIDRGRRRDVFGRACGGARRDVRRIIRAGHRHRQGRIGEFAEAVTLEDVRERDVQRLAGGKRLPVGAEQRDRDLIAGDADVQVGRVDPVRVGLDGRAGSEDGVGRAEIRVELVIRRQHDRLRTAVLGHVERIVGCDRQVIRAGHVDDKIRRRHVGGLIPVQRVRNGDVERFTGAQLLPVRAELDRNVV